MSKYKVGDKVILTVTSTNEMGCLPCYVLNDDLILSRQDIDKYSEPLSTYTEPLEDTIQKHTVKIARLVMEKEGLKDENERLKAENEKMSIKIDAYELYSDQHEEEYNQAFNQGAEAAWELARKIVIPNGYSNCDLYEIFESNDLQLVLENYTYPEATAKVAEWRMAKEEIKVGDVVRSKSGIPAEFCVTEISSYGRLYGIGRNGETYNNQGPEYWEKTGHHIDVNSFLKQIGGNENER